MDAQISALLDELASGRIPRGAISDETPHAGELRRLVQYMASIQQFTIALANGDLSASLPTVGGPVAGSLKSLHASLKHLTWQTKQIAEGDLSQHVDFMGEFSDSFNKMVERLSEARSALELMNRQLQENNIILENQAEALRESEERLRHIAENVSDVIWTLDRSMERFTYISPSIASLRGLSVDEALNEPLEKAMTVDSLASLRKALSGKVTELENSAEAGTVSDVIEVEQICLDGRVIHVEVVISAIYDADKQLKEFVGVSRDITARKIAEDQLKYQSTHDALTGLHNRAFFDAELELATRGRQFPVSIIAADLDGLKRVNDTSGHQAGDQLIKGAAAILQMAFRAYDVVARTGGDEFVILLREVDQKGATVALERIRACMKTYNEQQDGDPVSISLGAATASTGDGISQALKEADEQMYADKVRRKQQRIS